jgi:hypothetical protein
MKVVFLAAAVLATAGVAFYFGTAVHAAKASGPGGAGQSSPRQPSATHKALASKSLPKSLSLPMFFEPNQGQTAPQVKFLARGAGYGLFLTADEAVLQLQPSALSTQHSALSSQRASSSVIRMRLEGANSTARVSGASPLPGKSSYFIGNDPSKWHHDIPQFARVEYRSVYPGVDMVYHGDQGQLEYDFRVAPAADPNQIALSFTGASARIVSGDSGASGDLVLSTANGDLRFHAPRVYQPAAPQAGNASGNAEQTVVGSFRQLADNKIGFTIGDYDHRRELVIDPVLSYSTYLGGRGTEGGGVPGNLVQVAVDSALNIYLAGSTNSTDFPLPPSPPANPPVQAQLGGAGAQNIFIAKINPLNAGTGNSELVYATYLGSSGTDSLAGIAVDSGFGIYVAGTTTSSDSSFPTTSNAFQTPSEVVVPGTHGFLSKISLGLNVTYALTYSTYLAGNGTDHVTGLAIDGSQNAYVTGDTTSDNLASDNFPANPNGYQTQSNSPGNPQFFASKIDTNGNGSRSMLYSTYFGGGSFGVGAAPNANKGGGIAVDPSGTNVNMYITGTTNMLPGPTGVGFPLFNAQQSCLDEASKTSCTLTNPTNTDAFVAKINPNTAGSVPVYSTYLGGEGIDAGNAIAVDTSGNAYVVGSTNSTIWQSSGTGFQTFYGGELDAFVAKIGNIVGSVYPLTYFTYLGGSGDDTALAIQVDSVQAAHVAGSTASPDLTTFNAIQPNPPLSTYEGNQYGGAGDAFVALISTTLSGQGAGDYFTYLGGSQLDQGTGIALDIYNATYVAGTTQSAQSASIPFPITPTAYQTQLNGPQDAFVSKLGAFSQLTMSNPTTSPSPNPVAAGTQVAFTFDIFNKGPDNATDVTFYATVPANGLASTPTARVTSGSGTCNGVTGTTIVCNIPTLAPCSGTCTSGAAVEVDITPAITSTFQQVSVSGSVLANGGLTQASAFQQVPVVNFAISASTSTPVINAGDTAIFTVTFSPTSSLGYNATITPSQTTSPSMVTATAPIFNPTTVTLSGTQNQSTTLTIATVPRPVTVGSLLRRGSFYAAWLPIGGLSLVGLGIGVRRKRRRWLVGASLGLIAGVIFLQLGCGSSSSSVTTTGGTLAGRYTITITGSAGTGASQNTQVYLQVN